MAQARDQKAKKKSGFFGRMFKLVLFLAVVAGVGLLAGFKFGGPVVDANGQTIETGKWAWEDTAGFKSYTCHWFQTTKSTIKQVDEEYRVSERTKEIGQAAIDKGGALVDKAQEQLADDGPAAAPGEGDADRIAREREENFGFSAAEVERLPAGYIDALRSGQQAMRDGVEAYQRWASGRANGQDNDLQREDATTLLETARTDYERARELYPDDARPEVALKQIQDYLHQISKDSPAEY